MWMTLSFRARATLQSAVLLAPLCLGGLATGQEIVAPDAPRAQRVQVKPRPVTNMSDIKRPVELRSVTAGRVTGRMRELAGREFFKSARDPVYIQVRTVPGILGKPPIAAMPVIVLNGERLLNTRGAGRDTLVAFLPNREKLRDTNSVAVVWLGKEEPTITKKPLTFRRRDLKE